MFQVNEVNLRSNMKVTKIGQNHILWTFWDFWNSLNLTSISKTSYQLFFQASCIVQVFDILTNHKLYLKIMTIAQIVVSIIQKLYHHVISHVIKPNLSTFHQNDTWSATSATTALHKVMWHQVNIFSEYVTEFSKLLLLVNVFTEYSVSGITKDTTAWSFSYTQCHMKLLLSLEGILSLLCITWYLT